MIEIITNFSRGLFNVVKINSDSRVIKLLCGDDGFDFPIMSMHSLTRASITIQRMGCGKFGKNFECVKRSRQNLDQ